MNDRRRRSADGFPRRVDDMTECLHDVSVQDVSIITKNTVYRFNHKLPAALELKPPDS